MNCFSCKAPPARRALSRAAWGVLLTLYIYNIYPKSCLGVDVEVENIFDFSVPVGVIETGVVYAAVGEPGQLDWAEVVETIPNDLGYFFANLPIHDDSAMSALRTPYLSGFNTNAHSFLMGSTEQTGGSLNFNTFGSSYSTGAISNAVNPPTNLLFSSSDVSWLALPDLSTVTPLLDSVPDTVPVSTPLQTASPFVDGLAPVAGFWVTSLTPDIVRTFDGGILADYVNGLDENGIFGYLVSAFPRICSRISDFLNEHKFSVRRFIGPVCCLLYVILCFRWWLRRIFLVFEVFTGVSSGSDKPWSTDSEMRI